MHTFNTWNVGECNVYFSGNRRHRNKNWIVKFMWPTLIQQWHCEQPGTYHAPIQVHQFTHTPVTMGSKCSCSSWNPSRKFRQSGGHPLHTLKSRNRVLQSQWKEAIKQYSRLCQIIVGKTSYPRGPAGVSSCWNTSSMSLEISFPKIGVRNSMNMYKMHYTKLTLNCLLYLRKLHAGCCFPWFKIICLQYPNRLRKFGRKIICHFKVLNERHKTGSDILNLRWACRNV
jgi:hypothetical protein